MTYSSSLAMGRGRAGAIAGPNRLPAGATGVRQGRRLRLSNNTVMLVILACMLGLVYLTQVTKTNAYGFQINNLQQQQAALQSEHSDLEVASARLQSLDRVQTSDVAKNLAAVTPSGTVQD